MFSGDAIFRTDERVPASGIYSVSHARHRLAGTIALFRDETFPKCNRCDDPVTFTLIHWVPALDYLSDPGVRISLVELVPLEDDTPLAAVS
jgi:hypothetical protein